MNDFNPVRYTMEMQILGYGLMITGIILLILVAIGFTRIYNDSKENRRG